MKDEFKRISLISLSVMGALMIDALGITAKAIEAQSLPDCFIQTPSGRVINLDKICHFRSLPRSRTSLKAVTATSRELTDQNLYDQTKMGVVEVQAGRNRGTGFFIDREGSILTSAYLVDDVQTVQIKLDSRSTFSARVIRKDTTIGLALVRLNLENLSRLPLSKRPRVLPVCYTEKVKEGEWVFVVSHPVIGHKSFNQGSIGALAKFKLDSITKRNLGFTRSNVDLIRTDVSIYWNDLGSPLIDRYGSVVGMIIGGIDSDYWTIRASNQSLALPMSEAVNRFALPIANACGGRVSKPLE